MLRVSVISGALLLLASAGCTGVPTPLESPMQADEQVLGETDATAVGIILLGFIPINQNERFKRAYDAALQKHPGAKRLVDIEIQENWFWAVVLNGYKFTIRGKAVK